MFKKLFLFLTTLLGVSLCAQPLLLAQPVSALDSDIAISIFPTSQTLDLTPGQTYTGEISVANSGQQPFDFVMSVAPYQVDSETYNPDFTTENNYTRLASWITFGEDAYHLDPETSLTIKFRIDVPEDAVGGGQYAAILARTESGKQENDSIQTIPQVAAFLYGRINGASMNPSGEVAEQSVPGFVVGGKLVASETVYNTGNVDFRVNHSLTVKDFFSDRTLFDADTKAPDGTSLGSTTAMILPGTSRSSSITWDNTPQLGIFRVRQVVSFLGNDSVIERVVICCPLWLIFSIIGLLLLLILWIILAIRHHRKKRPQVF